MVWHNGMNQIDHIVTAEQRERYAHRRLHASAGITSLVTCAFLLVLLWTSSVIGSVQSSTFAEQSYGDQWDWLLPALCCAGIGIVLGQGAASLAWALGVRRYPVAYGLLSGVIGLALTAPLLLVWL